jgi:hypothetical protein
VLTVYVRARSRVIPEPADEETNDIILADEFDKTPVDPYQRRYRPEQIRAALKQSKYPID